LATGLGGWRLDEENGVSDLDGGCVSDGDEEVLHLLQLSHGLNFAGWGHKQGEILQHRGLLGGRLLRPRIRRELNRQIWWRERPERAAIHSYAVEKLDGEHRCGGDAEMEEVGATGRHKWSSEKE
jgi:hypothetical protein